jgi:hypothetical protein
MTIRGHLGEIRKVIRIARDLRHNVNLAANEELFYRTSGVNLSAKRIFF